MMKLLICIGILGVLLRGADADIDCFLEKMKGKDPSDAFIHGYEAACKKSPFDEFRTILKTCEVDNTISLDGFEALIKDVCNEKSDFRKAVDSSFSCLDEKKLSALTCMPQVKPEGTVKQQTKEFCLKRTQLYDCVKKNLGDPCKDDGKKVINRGIDAMESYLKGVCYLVGSASLGKVCLWSMLVCISFALFTWF